MQKTKLGISVGLLGAIVFLACLFNGFLAAMVLTGYILLFEENAWLKKAAVKGIVLLFGFAVLSALINIIPNLISVIDYFARIFDEMVQVEFITYLAAALQNLLNLAEVVVFLLLAVKAFNQGTIKIPVIDAFVDKYMG